jgi:hypothetical protein
LYVKRREDIVCTVLYCEYGMLTKKQYCNVP